MLLSRRAALAVPIVLAALSPAFAADSSLLTSTAPDRQEKLEAAAKKEGSLSLYTSIAQKDLQPIIEPFEKKYGIKVNVWRASGDTTLQRVIQEQRAGRYTVDVVHFGAPELEALRREKLLQPVSSPVFADLIDGAVPSHREWVSTLLSVWVQAYNTNLVKKEDLPKTYRDLLDPKWKDKLGFEVENLEWFMTVANTLGGDSGVQFFRDLVAAGEVPLALTVYNYMPVQAKEQGAPIDWFALEPAVARPNGAAILKNAQSPNAAALFLDYLLSDAQNTLYSLSYVPTSKKVETPLKGIQIEIADPAEKLDNSEKWEPLYQQIIVKRAAK